MSTLVCCLRPGEDETEPCLSECCSLTSSFLEGVPLRDDWKEDAAGRPDPWYKGKASA
jgi:hypothetical protein